MTAGVTAPDGFRATGVAAGLKSNGRPDVALVVNDGPVFSAAAVFTSNRVAAAPVTWTRQVVGDGRVDVVVLNSGGANACTGAAGFADTHRTAEFTAQLLGVSACDVAVCSTGLIGERLPMDKLMAGIETAVARLDVAGGPAAAGAIMTTDSVPKQSVVAGPGYCLGGMAKGAGMLAPGLATMLVVLTTDADVPPPELDLALRAACRVSFDRVDSDGCMSTNDTVLLMASGASGVRPDPAQFGACLRELCLDLAMQLLHDAEGAAHDIAVEVVNAVTESDAVDVGRAVARSNLFKAAVFGNDPNWGRILAAVGTTSAVFDPAALDVWFNGVPVCLDGGPGESREKVDLTPRQVHVRIDLKAGSSTATVWTNDLTHDYVRENSAYST